MNNVGNSLLSQATGFVDILEGIKLFGALVLDDPHLDRYILIYDVRIAHMLEETHLAKSSLSNCSVKVKMVKRNFTVKVNGFREAASHLAFREEEYRGDKWKERLRGRRTRQIVLGTGRDPRLGKAIIITLCAKWQLPNSSSQLGHVRFSSADQNKRL